MKMVRVKVSGEKGGGKMKNRSGRLGWRVLRGKGRSKNGKLVK